jgi:hypothetical protein
VIEVSRFEFVITDENDASVVTPERRHAVMSKRHQQAIGHSIASSRHNFVVVAIWQVEYAIGIRTQ